MTQGFTLIELLVVVLIIGILSAVALPQYQTAVERSRATEALTQMSAVSEAMQRYHAQHDAWPSADNFNALDVDIPTISNASCSTNRGGKNFCLSFTNAGVISAARLRNTDAYTLTTTITENNGAYSAARACTPTDNEYCLAISGGNPSSF